MAKTKETVERPDVVSVQLVDGTRFTSGSTRCTAPREVAATFALAHGATVEPALDADEIRAVIPAALSVASSFRSGGKRRSALCRCADLLGMEPGEGESDMALLARLRRAMAGDEITLCPSSLLASWLETHPRDAEALLAERRRTAGILADWESDYASTRETAEREAVRQAERSGELASDRRDWARSPWRELRSRWHRRSGADFGTHPDASGVYPSVRREATSRLAILDGEIDRRFRAGDVPPAIVETREALRDARLAALELRDRQHEVFRLLMVDDRQQAKYDEARAAAQAAEAEAQRLEERLRLDFAWRLAA